MNGLKKTIDKGIAYAKKNGLRGLMHRVMRKAALARPVNYEKWFAANSATLEELAWQKNHPLHIPEGWCLLMRDGIQALPDMEYRVAEAIVKHPEHDVWYTDHDYWLADGKHIGEPACKPDFDKYYLDCMNYIGGAVYVRQELLDKVNDIRRLKEDPVRWHEFLVQLTGKAGSVGHVPRILFREPWKYHCEYREYYETAYEPQTDEGEKEPLLSVIIPNKDHISDLRNCIESVIALGGYGALELLIVENNSCEEQTFAYYRELENTHPCVRILHWKKGFNYSAINNFAAQEAGGRYLLFLNNDTMMQTEGALSALMKLGRQGDVGAVGARLLYADKTIQHAGVVLGFGGIAGHAFEGKALSEYEKVPFARAVRQMSAVTAACMLVRRDVFFAVGGFDEALAVAYNDIDLCMKIRAYGKKVLYCPQAQLYHLESGTRGLEMTEEKAKRLRKETEIFCIRWQQAIAAGDPFYNPNLTLDQADYTLRR
ncbi:MAG: glycosyltransferase family 2 protein [Eubacteriales bacterium]|nr:glycosyltransferase family 2 protein [Eubacteriales bacterium]